MWMFCGQLISVKNSDSTNATRQSEAIIIWYFTVNITQYGSVHSLEGGFKQRQIQEYKLILKRLTCLENKAN